LVEEVSSEESMTTEMSKEKKIPSKKMMTGGQGFCWVDVKREKMEGKKSLMDFQYYLGSATHVSDYKSTTEYIINYVKKTFDYRKDIGTSLKELCLVNKEKWKVEIKFSDATDIFQKEQQNRQFEMEFKSDYEEYKRRINALESNMVKAYADLGEMHKRHETKNWGPNWICKRRLRTIPLNC
jgi:anthranilate/para-aminobenzoate synthase component I